MMRRYSILRGAVSLNSECEPAVLALGLLLDESGEVNEAARFFSDAVAPGPQKADPHKYLGMVELRRGVPDAAIASLSAAHRLAPDDFFILNELGAAFNLSPNRKFFSSESPCLEHSRAFIIQSFI